MMRFLYTTGIYFYGFLIRIAGIFNDKARRWSRGRKNLFGELEKSFHENHLPVAWIHCASYGEFEQGRPVMELLRTKYPEYHILLTFYSPSGYEAMKDYQGADTITYLPLDTRKNAKRFLKTVKPSIVLFVKYEYWYNYLYYLFKSKIPVYLVSARFYKDQLFFKWYGKWFFSYLLGYKLIFLQDINSFHLLSKKGLKNIMLTGDTRFDRVISIAKESKSIPLINSFRYNNKVWICGSVWREDAKIIQEVYQKLVKKEIIVKLLLVPHEVDMQHIKFWQESFPGSILYSEATEATAALSAIMIVDRMGLLSAAYKYAEIAYIGGGFGKGIHNITEAAVYGVPIVFGPRYQKFNEAPGIMLAGGGFSIRTSEKLWELIVHFLKDDDYRTTTGNCAKQYIYENSGAAEKIVNELKTMNE